MSDRVLLTKLNAKPLNMNIIQVYAPTSSSSEEAVEKFYEDIETAKKQSKSQEVTIIMGDFNAKIGNKCEGITVGSYGLGERNDRGEKLVEWCKSNKFMIANIWFKNHPRRLWTGKMLNKRAKNQIDFILMPCRLRNAVKFCKSMPGADAVSDHIPVISKFRIKLKKLMKTKENSKPQIHLLKEDKELRELYDVEAKKKYKTIE